MAFHALTLTVFCSCSSKLSITNYGSYQFVTPPFLSQKTYMEPTFMNEQNKRNNSNQRSLTAKQLQAALLWLAFQKLSITNMAITNSPPSLFCLKKSHKVSKSEFTKIKQNHSGSRQLFSEAGSKDASESLPLRRVLPVSSWNHAAGSGVAI